MSYGITLRIWGDYACFTRPEMKVERVSYDLITPSAARGILEAIYWKPSIIWVIDKLHVLKPIKFVNLRRNEVGCNLPLGNIKAAMRGESDDLSIFVEDERQQRAAMVLKDVEYVIEAHFEVIGEEDSNSAKHIEMFRRRAEKGQCYHQPYLGCKEFPAHFALTNGRMPESAVGDRDFGWMLHDIDYEHDFTPRFFKAAMKNGVVEVPKFESEEVKG
jgi:CRISPR-associated protein Cas5d